jgi:predicted  nucleic acid-binding Zn-ribbon protein
MEKRSEKEERELEETADDLEAEADRLEAAAAGLGDGIDEARDKLDQLESDTPADHRRAGTDSDNESEGSPAPGSD